MKIELSTNSDDRFLVEKESNNFFVLGYIKTADMTKLSNGPTTIELSAKSSSDHTLLVRTKIADVSSGKVRDRFLELNLSSVEQL